MFFSFPALALCATLCAPASQTLELPRVVHLRIERDAGLSAEALRCAAEQARLIWSAAGVTVTTGRLTDPVPDGAEIVAVRIESRGVPQDDGQTVLGWITLDERGVPSPIRVSLPGLQEVLADAQLFGRPVRYLGPGLFEKLTGQAAGRVIAHELGHYLLRSSRHAAAGLMQPSYSGTTLAGPSLEPFKIAAVQLAALCRVTVPVPAWRPSWPPY
jgi:hypothetical protein